MPWLVERGNCLSVRVAAHIRGVITFRRFFLDNPLVLAYRKQWVILHLETLDASTLLALLLLCERHAPQWRFWLPRLQLLAA